MTIAFALGLRYRTALRVLAATLLGLTPFSPGWSAPAKAASLPANSVYQLSIPLSDQLGRTSKLEDWRGKPVLISMFYSSCEFVCPRIVEAVKKTEESLLGHRAQVPVLMVSFDPVRDDTAKLNTMAEERRIDPKLWTLARTDARNVRKLAAILGIQYRELPSGEFNHSSVIILLDAEGRVVGKTTTLGEADPAFVKLVRKSKL